MKVSYKFLAPDRAGKISKFNFDAYAIVEASPAQIQQNRVSESKILRKITRPKPDIMVTQNSSNNLTIPSVAASLFGSAPQLSSSLGPSIAHGPQMFLRIRVEEAAESHVIHISSTIPVSAGMYMQEALESFCRKRNLDWREYALVVKAKGSLLLIPLDRTVASLQGVRELIIVERSRLSQLGIEKEKSSSRTTDPNGKSAIILRLIMSSLLSSFNFQTRFGGPRG